MVQQEKTTCPKCGEALNIGQKFCTFCGSKLFEVNETKSKSSSQSKLLIEGWEVSRDRFDKYELIMNMYPIGDPIITSKCKLDNENGFLVVSDNGFAWRIQLTSGWSSGKSKWVRWHDVVNIFPIKNSQILVALKLRKMGSLILDKKGYYEIKKWKLTIRKNKGEKKLQWKQRLNSFNKIMLDIFNRNAIETDPPISDSKM